MDDKSTVEKMLTPTQVGEVLGFRKSKIHSMIVSGEIPSVMVARGVRRRVFRVRPSALRQWVEKREAK